MGGEKTFYRRRLPHYQPAGGTFFVTFRLTSSIPTERIIQLREEREIRMNHILPLDDPTKRSQMLAQAHGRYFGKFNEWLDNAKNGPYWLKDERIGQLVADSIHYRDGKVYDLFCYTIMPNHVHMVFSVARFAESPAQSLRDGVSRYVVTDLIGSLKKHTALEANKILVRKGPFADPCAWPSPVVNCLRAGGNHLGVLACCLSFIVSLYRCMNVCSSIRRRATLFF